MIDAVIRKIFGDATEERPPAGPSIEELSKQDRELEQRLRYLQERVELIKRSEGGFDAYPHR